MLTPNERERTGRELRENYRISELTPEQVQTALEIGEKELNTILNLERNNADPTNVWRLRDYMEEKIKENGKRSYPYSRLKTNIYYPYK